MLTFEGMIETLRQVKEISHTFEMFMISNERILSESVRNIEDQKQFLGIEDILQTKLEHVQIASKLFEAFMQGHESIEEILRDFTQTDILDFFVTSIVESTLGVNNCISELSKLQTKQGLFSYLKNAKSTEQFIVRHKTSHPDPSAFVDGTIKGGKTKFRVHPFVDRSETVFVAESEARVEYTIEQELDQMLEYYGNILKCFERYVFEQHGTKEMK